jgi:hypothetical protein
MERAEADLPVRLDERLGGALDGHAALDHAVDATLDADRQMNEAAHATFGLALREALKVKDSAERETRVNRVVAHERQRLEGRDQTRADRAERHALRLLRLPDGALDG